LVDRAAKGSGRRATHLEKESGRLGRCLGLIKKRNIEGLLALQNAGHLRTRSAIDKAL
jgi:hypothetical protein